MVEAAKVLPGSEEALKLFQETDELERLAGNTHLHKQIFLKSVSL